MKLLAVLALLVAPLAASVSAQPASAPAAMPATQATQAMRPMSPKTSPVSAVPGPQRADEVWVNTRSGVYHCPGNRWYGRTPRGAYMSEADAKAMGHRPDAAKGCGA